MPQSTCLSAVGTNKEPVASPGKETIKRQLKWEFEFWAIAANGETVIAAIARFSPI